MSKKKHWVFVGDDDDRLEYWRDDKGNTRTVVRRGPPLHTVPAKDIPKVKVQGPPKDKE